MEFVLDMFRESNRNILGCPDGHWSGNIEFNFELSYVRRLDADLEPSPFAAHLLKLACNPFIYSK